MILVHYAFNDKTGPLEKFADIAHLLHSSGLEPESFYGLACPPTLPVSSNKFIDQDGAEYTVKGGIWKKTGQHKLTGLTDPKKPVGEFPSSVGFLDCSDELKSKFLEIAAPFKKISIGTYNLFEFSSSGNGGIWNGPVCGPQALAYYAGKNGAKFALHIGSTDFHPSGNDLVEVVISLWPSSHLHPSTHIQPVAVTLAIKTQYGDHELVDKPGATLGSVSKYIGPLDKVVISKASLDIHLHVPAEDDPLGHQMIWNTVMTGNPQTKTQAKGYASKPFRGA